jgi:hypothetical protein
MAYKNDSELVILGRYGKAGSYAKAELFETYDRIRDLTVSGPALGGSGMGKFSSMLVQLARTFGGSPFVPTLGSEAINIPGTSYYSPISGGNGTTPGGQAGFGLAPFAQFNGFPLGGAAPVEWSLDDIGNSPFFGASSVNPWSANSGQIVGGASPVGGAIGGVTGSAVGAAAGAGFGRNLVLPAAGLVSALGGILTTLGPFAGPYGVAGVAAGSVLNGLSGAILNSFQHVGNRVLVNADTILADKVKNLETTVKMLEAQEEIVKKLLKDSMEGDKKALQDL